MAVETDMPEPMRALDNPHRLNQNYFKLNPPDGQYLTGSVAVTAIVYFELGFWAMLGSLVVAGLCFIRRQNNRIYQLPAEKLYNLRRRRHPAIMAANPDSQSDEAPRRLVSRRLSEEKIAEREDQRSVMPYNVWRLGLSLPGEDQMLGKEIGMVFNRRRNTNSFGIIADGDNLGLTSLGQKARRERLDQFGNIMRNATYLPGYGVVYTLVFRQDPVDVYRVAADNGRWQHPAVYRPQPLGNSPSRDDIRMHNVALNATDGMRQVGDIGREPQMVTVVTVRQDFALRNARKEGLDIEAVPQLTVTVVADAILNAFREYGLSNPRILDGAGLHGFLRGAWDVTGIREYQKAILVNPELRHADQLHWPQRLMEAHPGFSNSDGTFSTVVRVKAAKPWISDSYWHQLFSMAVPYKSISVVNEAVKTKGDIWALDRIVAAAEQTRGFREGFGGSLGIEADIQRKKDRRTSLYESGVNQQSSIYLTLRTDSRKELAAQLVQLRRFCESPTLNLSLSPIMSPALQYPALMAGTAGLPW
jgi:hypothetical protein